MEQVMFGDVEGHLAAHTFPDLFYIFRKDLDVNKRKQLLLLLCEHFHVIAENKEIIKSALKNENWNDLEDSLQMQCALEKDLDYIVTRNIKDFFRSQIKAVLPEEWVALYKRQKL